MDKDKEQGGGLFRSLLGQEDTPRASDPDAPKEPPPPPGSTIDLTESEDTWEGVQERELEETLKSGTIEKRKAALRVLLGRAMTPSLATAAAKVLGDRNASLRTLALQVLERAPHLAPEGSLEAAARDSDPGIRARALGALGRSRRSSVLPVIEDSLAGESEESVVAAALTALGQLLQTSTRPFPPSSLRGVCAAVGALPAAARARHADELGLVSRVIREEDWIELLGDAAPWVRSGAALLTLHGTSRGAWEELASLTSDPESTVRDLAGEAARRARRSQAPAAATEAGFDVARFGRRSGDVSRRMVPRPPVQSRPARPHAPPPPPPPPPPPEDSRIEALLVDLRDEDSVTRARAGRILEGIPAADLQAWAERYLKAHDPARAAQVAELIASMGRTELIPHLCALLLELPEGREREHIAATIRPLEATWRVVDLLLKERDADRRAKAVRVAALIDPKRREPFETALKDHNSSVRLAAISADQGPPDERFAALLMEVISSDASSRVRVEAVARFWDAPPDQRVAVAEQALRSHDTAVRVAAVELLAGGSDEEMTLLARALHDADAEVAGRAITYLASLQADQALALLWSSLRQVTPAVQESIMDALQGFDREAVLFLGRQSLDSEDPEDRALGLRLLFRYDTSTEMLVSALDDPATQVRKEALRNLLRRPDPQAVHAVGARLRDPEPEIRLLALEVLPKTEDDRVLFYFVDGAKDPSPEVRDFAREAVLAQSPDAVAPLLIRTLGFSSYRRAAMDLLTEMGEGALDHLLEALVDAETEVKEAIGEVLRACGAGAPLVWRLSDRDPQRRLVAVEGLGAMGVTEATAPLIGRLQDPDGRVRVRTATVLGELGDPSAIEPLKRAFVSDPDMEVVSAIEPALRRLTGEGI